MNRKYSQKQESAVSETIGFMMILAIMIAGIGLVTLYGYPILIQEQANANVRNMERNMIVLQNDLKALTFKNVPYKETTLQISGGTLFVINPNPPPPQDSQDSLILLSTEASPSPLEQIFHLI